MKPVNTLNPNVDKMAKVNRTGLKPVNMLIKPVNLFIEPVILSIKPGNLLNPNGDKMSKLPKE